MKEFIEKLIGRLEEASHWEESTFDEDGYSNDDSEEVIYLHRAIEIVNQLAEEYEREHIVDLGNKICDKVDDILRKRNNGWIPCSERLPDAEADVLLSLRSLDIYVGFMANTEGMFYVEGEGYVEYENVLAWQPLPAPYQPEEGRE